MRFPKGSASVDHALFTGAPAASRVEHGMKRRLLCLALALGLGTSGCASGGQHPGSALPLVLVGGLVLGGILVAATHHDGPTCTDPAGRCGGTQYPGPPETH